MKLQGWKITGLVALLLIIMVVAIFSWHGATEAGIRSLIRNSAVFSLVLFSLAFSASSLRQLLKNNGTAWVLRNRRYIGVSFAVSHLLHLGGLILLAVYYPHPFIDKLNLFALTAGSIGYAFVIAMTITSFDGPRKLLGARAWSILHTTGSYYLWIVFFQTYLSRAQKDSFYIGFLVVLGLVMVLRLIRMVRRGIAARGISADGQG